MKRSDLSSRLMDFGDPSGHSHSYLYSTPAATQHHLNYQHPPAAVIPQPFSSSSSSLPNLPNPNPNPIYDPYASHIPYDGAQRTTAVDYYYQYQQQQFAASSFSHGVVSILPLLC